LAHLPGKVFLVNTPGKGSGENLRGSRHTKAKEQNRGPEKKILRESKGKCAGEGPFGIVLQKERNGGPQSTKKEYVHQK